ncbi:uncharacterized protein RJT21DRAFT_36006 [Scheffersomyces amazonensis]|uniref:uncharacterized protein n=1 Tax=Scheffersomyces amazonensis TaxID=1078765 RepID=UPI00315C5639
MTNVKDLEKGGDDYVPIIVQPTKKVAKNSNASIIHKISTLLIIGGILLFGYNHYSSDNDNKSLTNLLGLPWYQPQPPYYSNPNSASEIIYEIQPPVELSNFKEYNTTILFDEEELKDGLVNHFKIPHPSHGRFNGAFLTLNFTNKNVVSEVISDSFAVIEISIDGHPVWRTSTPYGDTDSFSFSSSYSNISDYISILSSHGKHHKKNRSSKHEVSIAVLEGSISLVDVSLSLTLTKSEHSKNHSEEKNKIISAQDIFLSSKPASNVIALVNEDKKFFTVPNKDQFKINLPKISSSFTIAKLNLFISATAEEIGYFKNDDDPIRHLNVFIGGNYVSTIIPKASLFHTESISKVLPDDFNPVVDFGNFVGLTYEVDLINVLPLLWNADKEEGVDLEIFVASPINDLSSQRLHSISEPITKDSTQSVKDSWFISGNLLLWNNNRLISKSHGEVIAPSTKQTSSGVFRNPPKFSPWQPTLKDEVAEHRISANSTSSYQFKLHNNETLNFTVASKLSTYNVLTKHERIITRGFGSKTTTTDLGLVYISSKEEEVEITDNLTNSTSLKLGSSTSFPINLSETKIESGSLPDDISVKVVLDSKYQVSLNGEVVNKIKVQENIVDRPEGSPIISVHYQNNDFKKSVSIVNGNVVEN